MGVCIWQTKFRGRESGPSHTSGGGTTRACRGGLKRRRFESTDFWKNIFFKSQLISSVLRVVFVK